MECLFLNNIKDYLIFLAPWSIKNWTISAEFELIAILSGHSLISKVFHQTTKNNIERMRIL